MFFFFFKQKTAYEMRISDWSSDVCSSDLRWQPALPWRKRSRRWHSPVERMTAAVAVTGMRRQRNDRLGRTAVASRARCGYPAPQAAPGLHLFRSEEHTSELQSLMRISYAVFCLKQKKTYTTTPTTHKNN